MYQNVIFREYDIRGVFNKEFNAEFAYELGKAYASYFKKKHNKTGITVTVGNDARLSALEIRTQLIKGLNESGVNVFYIGLVTSPISYFTTFEMEGVDGAIMITGSHNPPDYNGFKISVGKGTIFGEEIQELRRIIEKKDFINGSGFCKEHNIFPQYLERYKNEFGNLGNLNVVLDCGNGAAGCIVKDLFNAVGMNPTILFEEPDGRFPNHHPDPTIEKNLQDLSRVVKEKNAICGIGFDGDADRIGVVDQNGKMLYGDELMILLSRSILENQKGAKIIGDVKCSDRMYDDIKKKGGEPIMWKTGHSLIKEKIKTEKAPFGGEMSGHIFFADRNYGYDDALYAALRVCEILAKTKKTITELLAGLPSSFNTPEIRIDTTEEKKIKIVDTLKKQFSGGPNYTTNLIDGVRISFEDGWALARASNTQPVLVLRFESWTQDGLNRIQQQIEKTVNEML